MMTPIWTSEALLRHNLETRIEELHLSDDDAKLACIYLMEGGIVITRDHDTCCSQFIAAVPRTRWAIVKEKLGLT